MADYTATNIALSGESTCSVPISAATIANTVAVELSGITVNQNGAAAGSVAVDEGYIFQTFYLPKNYPRGIDETPIVPNLSGIQLHTGVDVGYSTTAALDWKIEYRDKQDGWIGIGQGSAVGTSTDGDDVWFNIHFTPIDVTDFWWSEFRFGITGRTTNPSAFQTIVPYDGKTVEIENTAIDVVPDISPAPLAEGKRYLFLNPSGKPSLLQVTGGIVYYSQQQGVNKIWYTSPNPLDKITTIDYPSIDSDTKVRKELTKLLDDNPHRVRKRREDEDDKGSFQTIEVTAKAFQNDGVTPILGSMSEEVSLRFRILSTAPDGDRDCIENTYRNTVVQKDPESVRASVGDLQDAFWLSAPNPSQFACESLYFDVRDNSVAQVIDHVTIDTVTPGIYMNVYFSNDPSPGVDTDTWDGLLWERVNKTFLLRRKESFALPEPVTAKYIKLEFTHLQPAWYAPGTFQLPVQYRKHPKWVTDYYFAYYEYVRARDLEHASTVDVTFDALDLAYNYYLDDLRQEKPSLPSTTVSADGVSLLGDFLREQQAIDTNLVDANTLLRIQTSLRPFAAQPITLGRYGDLLRQIAMPESSNFNNYSTEVPTAASASMGEVSSLNRDALIVEKQFPVTSFYLPCRHFYMTSTASFIEDRAYFAGIKEVAFTREHYASQFDNDLYIETAGDTLNIEINDFQSVDNTWVVTS